mmetsp:Transcript_16984/g.31804  ORF Transcript_16984/g.31804 Transcript_16984/m.31804 type:complete len:406 (-) Transcript_16984:123-1340(-)
MMTTASHVNTLCSKAAWNDQAEDSRSTSASGSDTETEVKQLVASSEENTPRSTTSENESELRRTPKSKSEEAPPGQQQPPTALKPEAGKAQVFVMWVLGLLRCTRRAPQDNTKYNREMLLQMRPLPGPRKKCLDTLPRTVLAHRKMQTQVVERISTTPCDFSVPPGLFLPPGITLPPGFTPPPGLAMPTGISPSSMKNSSNAYKASTNKVDKQKLNQFLAVTKDHRFVKKEMKEDQVRAPAPMAPSARAPPASPPGAVDTSEPRMPKVFDVVDFRKELVVILRELSSDWNVGAAVQRVRSQGVPEEHQAAQVVDIVTRAAEERRGVHRRLCFAFVAGLARADPSAFDKTQCITGLKVFFDEVYIDLCDEVPRLRTIIANEFVPTLRSVLPAKELSELLPVELRTA